MSFTPISYKIKNEKNIPLHEYGKQVFKSIGNRIINVNHEMTEWIYMDFTTPMAKHNERFVAKFDREIEGLRIYNITDSYLL